MGDISRHRDIFLASRDAIPAVVLERSRISRSDLTYVEIGNYLTDVSQFRDPVVYIFAKRRIWNERILPGVSDKASLLRGLAALALGATTAALAAAGRKEALIPAGLLGVAAPFATDNALAGFAGLDDWIDQLFGNPIEQTNGKRRTDEQFGYIGRFFQHAIEGVTHLLFAQEVTHRVGGEWSKIERIPEVELERVYSQFFTQYYPHEHTDMPPYVWDAGERQKPKHRRWYGRSRRQRGLDQDVGVMNVVDRDYKQYLAEGFARLEAEWKRLKPRELQQRQLLLLQLGKLLHGVEDWFFHSNVAELSRFRAFAARAESETEDQEALLQRFVVEGIHADPIFRDASAEQKIRLQRLLYRRLRFPKHEEGDRDHSVGVPSTKESQLSLDHAYPAFPSQQDTAHTLLGALENLESKVKRSNGGRFDLPPWLPCILRRFRDERNGEVEELIREKAKNRGVNTATVLEAIRSRDRNTDRYEEVLLDVMRELLPLITTLLVEDERQRLVANVSPSEWKGREDFLQRGQPSANKEKPADHELNEQLKRHVAALKPRVDENEAAVPSYYDAALSHLQACGFINEKGRAALQKAFQIDLESERLTDLAPGAGGFLISFAVDLQTQLDKGDEATDRLNKRRVLFDPRTDNGSFSETIGTHSLLSKDTTLSSPFFDDAKLLGGFASQTMLHTFLAAVSQRSGKPVDWPSLLNVLIRYPQKRRWEQMVLAYYERHRRFPKVTDVEELASARRATLSPAQAKQLVQGTKRRELEELYLRLEQQLSNYRYP